MRIFAHIFHRPLRLIVIVFVLIAAASADARESNIEKAGDALLILIPAGAYGAAHYMGDKEGRAQFCKSFLLNAGVTYALQLSVNKQRPDGSDNDSFPSGHTSVTFQGAAFIQKRYGWKYSIPAYIGAAFTGYSRVHADKHYAADVVAGAALGILSSYFFTSPYKNADVTPVAGNGFYGVNISRKW